MKKSTSGKTPTEDEERQREEIEGETRDIVRQANEVKGESAEATRRILNTLANTKETGANVLVELNEQGEQLSRIEKKQEKVKENLQEAERQLTLLERWFCCCFARTSNKKGEHTHWNEGDGIPDPTLSGSSSKAADPKDRKALLSKDGSKEKDQSRTSKNQPKSDLVVQRDEKDEEIEQNLEIASDFLGDIKKQAELMSGAIEEQSAQIDRITKKADKNIANTQSMTKRTNNVNTNLFAF